MEYNPGDVIGAYRLTGRCGSGSFGEVFLAENLFSGQTVALKLLSATEKDMKRELDGLIRFRSCRHPNLLPILHIDKIADRLYYTMSLADNLTPEDGYFADTLAHRLSRRAPLPSSEITAMTLELLAGTKELHRQKLLHRDVKPDNILWLDQRAVLADIGLVGDDSDASASGTPGFMPDDVLSGQRGATAADDLYALGKVIYCALTGLGVEEFPRLPQKLADPTARQLFRAACVVCSNRNPIKTVENFRGMLNQPNRFSGRRSWIWISGGVLLLALSTIASFLLISRSEKPTSTVVPITVVPALQIAPSGEPELPKPEILIPAFPIAKSKISTTTQLPAKTTLLRETKTQPELPPLAEPEPSPYPPPPPSMAKPEPSPYPAPPNEFPQSPDSKRLLEMRPSDIDAHKELSLLEEKYLHIQQRYTPELQEKCQKRSREYTNHLGFLRMAPQLNRVEAEAELSRMQSKDILCQLANAAYSCDDMYKWFQRRTILLPSSFSQQHDIMDKFNILLDFYDTHCVSSK